MELSTKINFNDLNKYDKITLRIDNNTVLELSLFEDELSIDIKTEYAKITKSQKLEMDKFKDIIKQCDSLDKKDIIKCCEKYLNRCYEEPTKEFEKDLNENVDSETDCKKLDSTTETIEKVKDYNKKHNIPTEKMSTIFKEMWYDDPVDDFVKRQKELDSEIYKKILALAKKWDEKNREKANLKLEKMGELDIPLKTNPYKKLKK